MAYLLHIDTSAEAGLVAVSAGGVLLAQVSRQEANNHAYYINEAIDEALKAAGIALKDLGAIAVCGGPGSYTGVRICLATAKGLCYALDIPLLLHHKLALLAYSAYRKHGPQFSHYIALLKARDNEYFMSGYDHQFANTLPPAHITTTQLINILKALENICIITNLEEQFMTEHSIKYTLWNNAIDIDAKAWAFFADNEYKTGNFVELLHATPFYMKNVFFYK